MLSTPTFVVFIGAGGSLASELKTIEKRQSDTYVVAPTMAKPNVGLNVQSVTAATDELKSKLDNQNSHRESARLIAFFYEGFSSDQFKEFWHQLGRSAWVEFVPQNLMHKVSLTRQHIERRINEVRKLLHEVSAAVFRDRRRAALPLPVQNFRSNLIRELDRVWYRDFRVDDLKLEIGRLKNRISVTWDGARSGFKDDRDLVFKPCKPNAEHGIAHPQGGSSRCFVAGRFRFGAALAPGFHYDVEGPQEDKPLKATLFDCDGGQRDLRPEKRIYINIHPNDHLRPA